MNKIFKRIICCIIAASMAILACGAAFASEGGDNVELTPEQLQALLELLAAASEGTENAEGTEQAEVVETAAPEAPAADAPAGIPEGTIDASTGEEVVLVDNDDVAITLKSVTKEDDNSYYAYTFKFFIQNKSDVNLYVTTDFDSINGIMCDSYWSETVNAGRKNAFFKN